MFQTDRTMQRQLFAFTSRDLIADDSDVWLYIDLFDNIDCSDFDSKYSSQGQSAKEPKLILRTLFYALTHGIVSGRKIQDFCRYDNRFIVLCGDTKPDRRTIDRFIRRHEDSFRGLFVEVVKIAQQMNLVSLGRVAIDGTKFPAFAGKHMRYQSMTRAVYHISENLDKLREDLKRANAGEENFDSEKLSKEIENQEQRRELIKRAKEKVEQEVAAQNAKPWRTKDRLDKSIKALHDTDALSMGPTCSSPFGYNMQAAVDETSQIIVAAEIHQSQSDQGALDSMIDKVGENCGQLPKKILADCGYNSLKNIISCEEKGPEAIIPLQTDGKETPELSSEQISKGDGDRDYYCLANKKLFLAARGSDGYLHFKLPEDFCADCPFANRCKIKGKKATQILDDTLREKMNRHAEKTRSAVFKEDYRWRKAIVEPVFGNLKNKGLRIYVRGLASVANWWKIAATAHNIEKIIGHRGRIAAAM